MHRSGADDCMKEDERWDGPVKMRTTWKEEKIYGRNEKEGEWRVKMWGVKEQRRQMKRRGGKEGNGGRGMEEGEENCKNGIVT